MHRRAIKDGRSSCSLLVRKERPYSMKTIHPKKECHYTERTERIRKHVLLRIPDIALAPKIRCTCERIRIGGVDPLNEFITHGESGNDEYRIRKKEEAIRDKAFRKKPLTDRIRVESDRKMRDTVIMVTLETKKICDPIKRHPFECIMTADRM